MLFRVPDPLREDALLAGAFFAVLWRLPPLLDEEDVVFFFVPPEVRAVEVGFFAVLREDELFVCAIDATPYALSLNQMRMDSRPTNQQ